MMKWIKFISSLVISYVLGFTLNKGLSATNIVESSATEVILNYNLPFIYTVRLNEIAVIISLTVVGFFIVCSYYEKSESSLEEIFKIMIKVLWSELFLFSFIIGTWTDNLLKKLEKDSFCYIYDWNILFFSISVMIFLYICFNQNRIKNKFDVKKESDLYPSRKNLLPIIDEYLRSIGSISIIGDWGIGKSKLIENFFHTEKDKNGKKYSDKYESIIIDVSSYSENKKIVNVIQNELIRILKKYRILKLNIDFVEKVFVDNSDFFKSIKNIFFYKESLIESKEELNKKIKELYEKKEKRIVLCLDNLERLSDVDRIINLLSITDELLSKEIKKIYLYDKKYMRELFENKKINFIEYMNKYSGVEIDVKEARLEEINRREVIEKFKNILDEKIRKIIYFKQEEEQNIYSENYIPTDQSQNKINRLTIIIKELEDLLQKIDKKLTNPRYSEYLISFIKNEEIKFEEYIKFEYRIIIDIIKDYTFELEIVKEIFIDESKYEDRVKKEDFLALLNKQYEKTISLEEQKIQKLKEEGIKTNNSDELIKKIDELIKDKQVNIVKEIFEIRKNYKINSFNLLETFLELYLKFNIDIKLKEKMEINIGEEFFNKKEKYGYDESKKIVLTILIMYKFTEVKKFILYLYNKQNYENINKLFKSEIKEFEKNLKTLGNFDLKKLVDYLDMKFLKISSNKNILFNYINKNMLEKEIEILKNFNFVEELQTLDEEINDEIEEKKIFLEGLLLNKIEYREIFDEEEEKINIKFNALEIDEEINEKNIKIYISALEKIEKKHEILEKLYYEIFLLKERLKKVSL